jgi:membrane-bound acyltransferase YfiQ involved in biofilm formation
LATGQLSFFQVLGQLTFLNSFFGNNELHPAAFWYLRVAFEFYILYALLLRHIPVEWLLPISLVVSLSFLFYSKGTVETMKIHSIGWLFEFTLGMYTAKNGRWLKRIENAYCSLLLFVVLIFSSINGYLWFFSGMIAVLFFLSIKRHLTKRLMIFLGTISAFLYVAHPVIRDRWVNLDLDYMNGNLLYVFLSICAYFLVCVLAAHLYGKFYKKVLALMHGAFSKK